MTEEMEENMTYYQKSGRTGKCMLALEEFSLDPKSVPSNGGPSQVWQLLYLCYLPHCYAAGIKISCKRNFDLY